MTTATKQTTKTAATEILQARGAELLKAEDGHGETRTGWWMDGVWLAGKSDPISALRVLDGGN